MAQRPVIGLAAAISGAAHIIANKIEEEVGEATTKREYLKSTLQTTYAKNKTAQKKVAEEIEECRQSVAQVNIAGEEKIQKVLQESQDDYEKLRQEYSQLFKSLDDEIERCRLKESDAITEGQTMKERILLRQEKQETEISEKYGNLVDSKQELLTEQREKILNVRLECEKRETELEQANREREMQLANEHAEDLREKDRTLENSVAVMYSLMAQAQELAATRVMEAQLAYTPRPMLAITMTNGEDKMKALEGNSKDLLEIIEIEDKSPSSLERSLGLEPS